MENNDTTKLSLLKILINATGVLRRTISKDKQKHFISKLQPIILDLINKSDNNVLTNKDIRSAIKKHYVETCISIGASQKVINVYMKFYCIIGNKTNLIKELDCPIDSRVIKANNLPRVALKNLDFHTYEAMQKVLKQNHGYQLYADVEAYDKFKAR